MQVYTYMYAYIHTHTHTPGTAKAANIASSSLPPRVAIPISRRPVTATSYKHAWSPAQSDMAWVSRAGSEKVGAKIGAKAGSWKSAQLIAPL